MIPRFSLARPRTLEEAFAAHAAAGDEGAYYAGGTELLQVMKMGLAQFATLVDLKGIDGLRGIAGEADGGLRIGGTTTHREIERSTAVQQHLPALSRLETDLANVRVRNAGTLGGNLAFAEPHSDPATFLQACGADVELAGPAGRRRIPVGEFILGPLTTARQPDEILTAIRVPAAGPGEGRGYAKIKFFERPAASVAVRLRAVNGRIAEATVVAGSLTERPVPVPRAAAALVGVSAARTEFSHEVDAAVRGAGDAFDELDVVADLNGSPDYKRHLATVLLRRATSDALSEAAARA